jgi:hypothetical protein
VSLALRLEHRLSPMAAESAHGADEARSLENDVFRGASRCDEGTGRVGRGASETLRRARLGLLVARDGEIHRVEQATKRASAVEMSAGGRGRGRIGEWGEIHQARRIGAERARIAVERDEEPRATIEITIPNRTVEAIAERLADLLSDQLGSQPETWIGIEEVPFISPVRSRESPTSFPREGFPTSETVQGCSSAAPCWMRGLRTEAGGGGSQTHNPCEGGSRKPLEIRGRPGDATCARRWKLNPLAACSRRGPRQRRAAHVEIGRG